MDLKPSTLFERGPRLLGWNRRPIGRKRRGNQNQTSERCTTHYEPRVAHDPVLDCIGSLGAGRPGRAPERCSVAARPVASSSTGAGAGAPSRLAAAGGHSPIRWLAGSRFASATGGDPRGSATPAADV